MNYAELAKAKILAMLGRSGPPLMDCADLLLVRGYGPSPWNLIGDGITALTGGVYAHAALVDGLGSIIEAEPEGIVRRPLSVYLKPEPKQSYRLCLRRWAGVELFDPGIMMGIKNYAQDKVNKVKYDYGNLMRFASFIIATKLHGHELEEAYRDAYEVNTPGLQICSEMVARAYYSQGLEIEDHMREEVDCELVSPNDLYNTPKFKTIWEGVIQG